MRPDLAALAATQHGLVTRAQALRCGYSERELRTLTRPGGEWATVRRGVYVPRFAWDTSNDRARQRLRLHAVFVNARKPLVASHSSAALLHDLDLLDLAELVHVTRTGVLGGRNDQGVSYHPARIPPRDVVRIDGHDVTSLARTAVDVAREDGYLAGLVVADQVLRRGVPRDELQRVVTDMKNWPRITGARAVVRDADAGAHSVGESVGRPVVTELGFGRPQTQFQVTVGGRTFSTDFRISWHLYEMDGRVKYGTDRPYDDERAPEEVLWDEKQREDLLRSVGHGMSRFIWVDLWGRRRDRLVARLRRETEATRRRVGERAWAQGLEETRAAIGAVVDASIAS